MATANSLALFEIEDVFFDDDDLLNDTCTAKADAATALARCINDIGYVDPVRMSEMSGLTVDELIDALDGTIFQDPEGYDKNRSVTANWILRAQYLSGNITQKLRAAKKLDRKYNGRFASNIKALKSAKPEKVKLEDIGINIESSWIPAPYHAMFLREKLALSVKPSVTHSEELGQWKVKCDAANKAVSNIYTFGTSRMPALRIYENTLNGIMIKVYDEVPAPDKKSKKSYILNKNETLAAREKQELLQQEFRSWIKKDPERVKRLEQIFYDMFTCNLSCKYDGSFLTLPDLSPEFTPYDHQKNAVARVILEKDVLLNHTVGSGKTNIIIMGIHERKRMGLSDKNLIVVPNNVLDAFETAHHTLYPNDKILVVHSGDFAPEYRNDSLKTIRDNDFTAIYMAYSSFNMLNMSRKYKLNMQQEKIAAARAHAASAEETWEQKAFKAKENRLKAELFKMEQDLKPDIYITFDELGITTLVVDEAHNYKNITLGVRAEGIVGLHAKGSFKCDEMLEKSMFVRSNGGGLILATGTPITNSLSDLFVMQTLLQPEQLNLLKLGNFEKWIGTFANRRSGFEIDVDAKNFRIMSRFSSFHNLPELMGLFSAVCDHYDGDNICTDIPQCGDYIDIHVHRSPEQADFIDEISMRADLVRAKLVSAEEDNLLKITHDGRTAALDIRLAKPDAEPDIKGTKAYICSQNVYKCWKDNPGTTQLIFCDIGTPKNSFNIYNELKQLLTATGIPKNQIAFIHDATSDEKRKKLFAKFNNADVRVLIGSTQKLGTGVNVQKKLIAIHHLDVPWRPSDIIQREGRMLRQGNTNKICYRYRYFTGGTFDSYSWQILENKQRFISQFMNGLTAERDMRDIDDMVLSYAEIKALSVGDPLIRTRIETSTLLEKAKINHRRRQKELNKLKAYIEQCPEKTAFLERTVQTLRSDSIYFAENRESMTKDERIAFGEELLEALADNVGKTNERLFDTLHGFNIVLPADMTYQKPFVFIEGTGSTHYTVDMRNAKPSGCVQRIENVLKDLERRILTAEKNISGIEQQRDLAIQETALGNPYVAEVAELTDRIIDIDEELNRRADSQKNTEN